MRFATGLAVLALVAAEAAAQPSEAAPRLDSHGDPLPAGALLRLGTTRFLGPSPEDVVPEMPFRGTRQPIIALSPDGKTVVGIVSANKQGSRIAFMDTSTGKITRTSAGPVLGSVGDDQVQYTADGKSLVLTRHGELRLVDIETGDVQRQSTSHRGGPLALSSDGVLMAAQLEAPAASPDAPVGLWEVKTGKKVHQLPGRGCWCKRLQFSPDGQRLLLWSVVPTESTANSRSFGPSSRAAVVCIDVKNGKILGETTANCARDVAFSPDGETVALEADDQQSVRVRHLPTGTERCSLAVKAARSAFTADGTGLVAFDHAGQGTLWHVAKGVKIRDLESTLVNKDFQILGAGRNGLVAVLDGGWESAAQVAVWDTATGKRRARPAGHDGAVTALAYAADSKWLVSGSIDKTVRLWDPATGAQVRILTSHPAAVTAVAVSADGKLAASACQSGAIRVCNCGDGKVVLETTGPARGATTLAFSANGQELFAGGDAPTVLAWEVAGGKQVVRLATGERGNVLAFAPEGALALTVSHRDRFDRTPPQMHVWNPRNAPPLATVNLPHGEEGAIRCERAVFSPNNRLVASSQVTEYLGLRASYGKAQVIVWECVSGQAIRTLSPSVTNVLAFSPDGRRLAAGKPGNTGYLRIGYGAGIDIWDTLTGQRLAELAVTPRYLAFSPDGQRLATAGADHTILIWEAPKAAPPEKAGAPTAAELDARWQAFAGKAEDAYQAMQKLLATPDDTVAFLQKQVRPEQKPDPEAVGKLIAQLDSESFNERKAAQDKLEKMGEGAEPHFKKALEGKVNLELRRRLEALVARCKATSPVSLQNHRSVAVLEMIGTPGAIELLRTLAGGVPNARLTMEARSALQRLEK